MKNRSKKTSIDEKSGMTNGFHQNTDDSQHIMNGKKLMNGECNKNQFRDQVSRIPQVSHFGSIISINQ